jgi:hypothetical protein
MVRCASAALGLMLFFSSESARAADLGDLLVERASDFSNEFGARVGEITGHVIDMRFDWRRLKAHVRLGGSASHFDCQGVVQEGGTLRLNARIDLDLGGGHTVVVVFPTVDMAPQDLFGRQQVIVRLPIYERRF